MRARPTITSTKNQRLTQLRRIRRRRSETPTGAFLVEGHRQLRAALDAGADVREVYTAPALYLRAEDEILVARAERSGARIFELEGAAFRSVAGNARPDGLLAVVSRWPSSLDRLGNNRAQLLAVAHAIERPGNLGTLIRTASAAGAGALLVSDPVTDVFHPDAVHGSVGALFHLPLAQASAEEIVLWLRGRGIRIVVATPDAGLAYWDGAYAGPVAVVVGSERHGVGDRWNEAADQAVRIPMSAGADSLNVAVAAGIVLFEAVRGRRPVREALP